MENLSFRLIHLLRCRHMTRRRIRKLLHIDSSLKLVYTPSFLNHKRNIFPSEKAYEQFQADLNNPTLINQIKADINTYHVITIVDENYPLMLKQIKDPPLVLYAKGNLSLLHEKRTLSVIGTRNPTKEAWSKMEYILNPLILRNFVIVSGMAKGIDGYAHKLSLQLNGKTIAVLGSGFNYVYPKEHTFLFEQIATHGLVISEYPPSSPPKKYQFPERNRIISGLAKGTLVIEAKERSGTMITVDQALDQGRDVFALADSPLVLEARGCNQMIQDGAKLVYKPVHIVEELYPELL